MLPEAPESPTKVASLADKPLEISAHGRDSISAITALPRLDACWLWPLNATDAYALVNTSASVANASIIIIIATTTSTSVNAASPSLAHRRAPFGHGTNSRLPPRATATALMSNYHHEPYQALPATPVAAKPTFDLPA